MTEIQTYNINNLNYNHPSIRGGDNSQDSLNLEAHTSTNMKVKRPKVSPNDLTIILPDKKPFSDKEATKRMQTINTDIYEGTVKEKEKHEFNFKRYLSIFGIMALLTAAIAYFRRGK